MMRKLVLAALAAFVLVCPRDSFAQSAITHQWSVVNTSAAAGTATASKAAATGFRHVAMCLNVSIAVGAAAQTPITWVVRDGATGAGTIIWTGTMSAAAAGTGPTNPLCGLNLVGTAP
jgi:hypothetical protein